MSKYALNLSGDGRVLSVTYPQYAPAGAPVAQALPQGDVTEYRYVDEVFVHDPMPAPQHPEAPGTPGVQARLAAAESAIMALMGVV